MNKIRLAFHDQAVELRFPPSLAPSFASLFPTGLTTSNAVGTILEIVDHRDHFTIESDDGSESIVVSEATLPVRLMEEVTRCLVTGLRTGVALHAGAVGFGGRAVLLPGETGSGKSSLTAWLVDRGFDYLSDELALLTGPDILGFPRALVMKNGAAEALQRLPTFQTSSLIRSGSHLLGLPAKDKIAGDARPAGLIIFPKFKPESEIRIEAMSPGRAALRLVACNLNARNLRNGGLDLITDLARQTAAINLHYGAFAQLQGTLDVIIRLILGEGLGVSDTTRLLGSIAPVNVPRPTPPKHYAVHPETPRRRTNAKLTVGMPTYDDYDGTYFSLQSLRLYHPEVLDDIELVVIDNHPDGPCSASLKQLEKSIANYRYVPKATRTGTSAKQYLFEEAAGDFVLCIDCHVLIVPGAIKRLLDYIDANPGSNDLLQGPLVFDDMSSIATHLDPVWRGGFYGCWAVDERGKDPDAPPFEIGMQGMGLFGCRKQAWPGHHPHFRGFGGEAGYLHEKFRQRGGKTLCLPFLRWLHRFNRPLGVPYHNSWHDRIRNYIIGFEEVGLPTDEMRAHFTEVLGAEMVQSVLEAIARENRQPACESAPSADSISTAC